MKRCAVKSRIKPQKTALRLIGYLLWGKQTPFQNRNIPFN
jgi:hypothetical protein